MVMRLARFATPRTLALHLQRELRRSLARS
jgi:hypothetical protein